MRRHVQDWEDRLKALEQETALLETGDVQTRERSTVEGRAVLIDSTDRSIERNKQWMADLKVLLAQKSIKVPRSKAGN